MATIWPTCLDQFLENFEELFKTRWANSSQPEMAKTDWYQRVTIG